MIAAPFLGEFGWEVSLWVPYLRWLTQHTHKGKVFHVICKPGHEALYEDFATCTIPYLPMGMNRRQTRADCQHCWFGNLKVTKSDYREMVRVVNKPDAGKVITPYDLHVYWKGNDPPILLKSEYRPYGVQDKIRGWVAAHARYCTAKQPERNWSMKNWEQLFTELDPKHIIWVGSQDDAYCTGIGENLIGMPLKEVTDAISRCEFMVGPSSGPMALSLLCRTPVVWWSGNVKDKARFSEAWNPFDTEQVQVSDSWDPEPMEVEAICQRFL